MKKTILYILLLAALAFGVYYFVFREQDAFGSDEAGFTVKDTASIGKIFLADKKGNTILLERKEAGWLLNGKYAVMESPLNGLLATLYRQQASTPVPEQAHNTVITVLAGNGVKVELYDRAGDKMKVFYVGGQANNNAGSYMLMEGASTAYIVQIPGFQGYITPRYATELVDWRDRTVFDVPVSQLQSVSVQYDAEPLNSYTLTAGSDGKFVVTTEPSLMSGKQMNARRVEVYSKYFEKVYCEGYVNGVYKLDSIIKSTAKRCNVDVTAKDGTKKRADIYWMPINKRSKNMLKPFPGIDDKYDADRFFAVINNAQDTVIIQRMTFDKILRKGWEFYSADDTTSDQTIVPKGTGIIKMNSGK